MLNPSSPLFIELLLWLIYGLLAVAVGLTAWSLLRALRLHGRGPVRSNGIAVGRIAWGIAVGLVLLLGITYLTGSTQPLVVNGKIFADTFWLRLGDMLINTSLVLIAVAAAGVLFGVSGLSRRIKF